MIVSLIVAYDQNRAIGKNNQLPWQLPADLSYFKKMTMGKPIVMGRKTFESIGRPLPGRRNIVISRDKHFEGCETFGSLQSALQALQDAPEVMIIGGGSIYAQALSFAHKIYATEIEVVIENADVFFPKIDETKWHVLEKARYAPDDRNCYFYTFVTFQLIEN